MPENNWLIVSDPSYSVYSTIYVVMVLALPLLNTIFFKGIKDLFQFLSFVQTREEAKKHFSLVLWLPVGFVLALGPWGYSMLETHPCAACFLWTICLLLAGYSLWKLLRAPRWIRGLVLAAGLILFVSYAKQFVYAYTELSFPFVNPGVFSPSGRGRWLILVTGENANVPLSHVEMVIQDMATSRAIPNETNLEKRTAMIRGGTIQKTYPDIGPLFSGDRILWAPLDVNDQEYSVQSRYRIGTTSYMCEEEIKIVNVGERFISDSQQLPAVKWAFSVTVKNQGGQVLMSCVDEEFPRDKFQGTPCFPGSHYKPFERGFCSRCFDRGFEFKQETK